MRGDGPLLTPGHDVLLFGAAAAKDLPMSYPITRNGRVTLPKWAREALGVAPGDAIAFRLNDRGEWVVEKAGSPAPREGRIGGRPARRETG